MSEWTCRRGPATKCDCPRCICRGWLHAEENDPLPGDGHIVGGHGQLYSVPASRWSSSSRAKTIPDVRYDQVCRNADMWALLTALPPLLRDAGTFAKVNARVSGWYGRFHSHLLSRHGSRWVEYIGRQQELADAAHVRCTPVDAVLNDCAQAMAERMVAQGDIGAVTGAG